MTAPTQSDAQQPHPSTRLDEREGDYLMVDEPGAAHSPPDAFLNVVPFNKLDSINKSDFKVVQTNSSLAAKLASAATSPSAFVIESAQHVYKHAQYYSPVNNNFVELPDPVQEELNENDQVDEYLQVELGEKKPAKPDGRLEVISSEPSSEAGGSKEDGATADENAEERDYIGIESFSSNNTGTNQELTENFECSNLSPISSTSIMGRVKTFSTSSNTSNNELNSLGTSPSLISSTFYSQTPVNHPKEEVYKLEKVKSYFQTPEDDYIRPARAYSIGTRFERPKLSNMAKVKHCPAMTKSKSNTINGPTISNTSRKGKEHSLLVRKITNDN